MLSCGFCRRICLQNVIGHSLHPWFAIPTLRRKQHRKQTYISIASHFQTKYGSTTPKNPSRYYYTEVDNAPKRIHEDYTAWQDERSTTTEAQANQERPQGIRRISKTAIQKHLGYLQDPLKLAEFVRKRCVNINDFTDTLEIVRVASKTMQCPVSWNHLINFQMQHGKMNAAIKTYNEMKKRAQFPDAWTYTILIRGCTNHPSKEQALEKGLAIYRSMRQETSVVKPSTIHINAVLKLCAQCGDIATMLNIVAEMPSTGTSAPNNISFTTVLNALHMEAVNSPRTHFTPMQKRQYTQKALLNGRRIWAEITERWCKGDLWLDEDLVCAMGRLLLLGDESDHDDVLTLIEGTMDIPRQIAALGTDARARIEPSQQESSGIKALDLSGVKDKLPITVEPSNRIVKTENRVSGTFALPGQNTLSLLMQVLLAPRYKDAALKYWLLFTKDLRVEPDGDNFHAFLRILRVARASTQSFGLLQSMPAHFLASKSFRIAMSACRRDVRNPNSFTNAGKLLDLMSRVVPEPSVDILKDYLSIGLSYSQYSEKIASDDAPGPSKYSQGRIIIRALHRINPFYLTLASRFKYEQHPDSNHIQKCAGDILGLLTTMISAYDVLLNRALVPQEQYSHLKTGKSKLMRFQGKLLNDLHGKQQIPYRPGNRKLSESNPPSDFGEHEEARETNKDIMHGPLRM